MSDEIQGTPPAPPSPPPPAPPAAGGGASGDTGKILAALGYIIGIVALIAILVEPYKDDKFVRHHAVQALGLWVVGVVLGVVSAIPVIGWLIGSIGGIVLFVVAIIAAIKAFQGDWYEVPFLYGAVKQYI
jgi:uncharacterized membrane protein